MSSEAVRFLQHENARLHTETQLQQAHIQTLQTHIHALADLYYASHEIMRANTALHTLDQLFEEVISVVGAKDGSLLKLDPQTKDLMFVLVHGQLREELPGHHIPSDVGVAGWVVQNQEPVIVNEPHQDWRFSFEVDQEFAFLTQSILCVPVQCGEALIGVIEFINKEPGKFADSDLVLVQTLAHIAAIVLEKEPDYSPPPESEAQTNADDALHL
ncbi:MAG: GAF domain-containing protein [Anaerolineae bacterium]|nr:GAF domain-containing protein [Anaerolineae bacterium]